MPNDISEKGFETAIKDHLLSAGHDKGPPADFDAERAIESARFLDFVQTIQPAKWSALQQLHGANTSEVVLDELRKAIDACIAENIDVAIETGRI
jgi:type I restriction enzyme R subunit